MSYKDDTGQVHLINLGENKPETRTALFWDNEEQKVFIGDMGISRFMDGYTGRLIQSPKSFLNSKEEPKTVYGGKERKLGDIITSIIADFRKRFIETTGSIPDHIRIGRPVRFHDTDDDRDQLAQNRLEIYTRNAGFSTVEFEYEPVAAAKTYDRIDLLDGKLLLVADFGGGTSDFSLVNFQENGALNIVGNDGVYVAGNDFDQQLSLKYFSRFLGHGTKYFSGLRHLEIPSQAYHLLSDWKNIHKLNDPNIRIPIENMRNSADEIESIDRLIEIMKNPELGYEYFRMVERAKIVISQRDIVKGNADFFRNAFEYILTGEGLRDIVMDQVEKIRLALRNALKLSEVRPDQVGKILLVGGTGQLRLIQEMLAQEIGKGKTLQGDTFNAVGKGLSM